MSAAWVAVDWGTSNLRAWAMDASGSVQAEGASCDGMAGLSPDGFEGALLSLIGEWLGPGVTPVVACGMVGARQGWAEAPYRAVPCGPSGAAVRVPTRDPRLAMHILPGLRQDTPPDVMRGEETQVAGFLAREPSFDGLLCLPGTHSKWVEVAGGAVTGFSTAMTGEVFDLLATASVLRHSVGQDAMGDGFEKAVSDAMEAPALAMAHLFTLRAADLLTGAAPADARARLSGLLIGVELEAMQALWPRRRVVLIGAEALTALYQRAFSLTGIVTRRADATRCTLDGLRAAYLENAP